MKNSLRQVMSVFLAFAVFALTLVTVPAAAATNPQATDNGQNNKLKKIETMRGESARQHVRALRARHKGLNRAMKDMEKQGRQVDWENSAVLFTIDPTISQAQRAKYRNVAFSAQDAYLQNADGEMSFITYHGADNNWEGTVYVTDYSTGATDVYNSVVDSGGFTEFTEAATPVYEAYYPPDGGDPSCGGNYKCMDTVIMAQGQQQGAIFQKASYPRVFAAGFLSWLSKFFKCLGRSTSYFAERCVAPSPSFRNNLICAVTAAFQAAGCCAANAKRSGGPLNPNSTGPGGGYCYR